MLEIDEEDLTDRNLIRLMLASHFGVATSAEASELILVPATARPMVRDAASLLIRKSKMRGWPRVEAIRLFVRMYHADTTGNRVRHVMKLLEESVPHE